jgi:hypothetical protein
MKSILAKSLLAALSGLLAAGSTAAAGTYRIDTVQPYPVRTTVVYRPGIVYTYSPVTPAVTYYAPPVVTYPGPAPFFAYRPGAYLAPAPVYYPAAVVVRPKVYVRGQPVRNMLRAVTP